MPTTRNRERDRLLLIFVCLAAGCINNTPTHPVDAAALVKVEKFRPKSVMDRRGRVVELVLEGSIVNDEALAALQDLRYLPDPLLRRGSDQLVDSTKTARQLLLPFGS